MGQSQHKAPDGLFVPAALTMAGGVRPWWGMEVRTTIL